MKKTLLAVVLASSVSLSACATNDRMTSQPAWQAVPLWVQPLAQLSPA